MKYVKPIAATLAVALLAPAFAGYAPAKGGSHASCNRTPHHKKSSVLLDGNSPRSGVHSHRNWFERIHLSGFAHVIYANTRSKDATFTNNNDGDNTPGTWAYTNTTDQAFQINNAELFVDAELNQHVDAHLDLHYSDTDVFEHAGFKRLIDAENNGTTQSTSDVQTRSHEDYVHVDEAFVTYYDKSTSPLFVKVGKMFSHFGNYHDVHTPNPSLEQAFTEMVSTGIEVGVESPAHWGASAWVFDKNLHDSGTNENTGLNKWGARLAYDGEFQGYGFDINASFINDARVLGHDDSETKGYFLADISDINTYTTREAAYDVHLGVRFEDLKAEVGYAAVASDLGNNLTVTAPAAATVLESKPQIWSFGLAYKQHALGHDHHIHVGYETVDHGGAIFHAKEHYDFAYEVELSPNFEGYVSYDDYKLASNVGFETNTGVAHDYQLSNNTVRVWLVGLKAHI